MHRCWLIWCIVCSSAVFLHSSAASAAPASNTRLEHVLQRVSPRLIHDLAPQGLRFGAPIFVRIFKHERELEVWMRQGDKYQLFKSYAICTYSGSLGPKLKQGDKQSPEGFYFVTPARMNPWSRFHLSFNLGYPNAYDRALGRTGNFLMVHGNCVSIGCYAMTDPGIEEIYTLAHASFLAGEKLFRVHVFPFRLSPENLEARSDSRWIRFWANLRTGYDWFERHHRPPNVVVRDNRYMFEAD